MSLGGSGSMSLVSLVRLVTRMWRMFRMSELGPWSLLTCRAGCGAAASETELLSRRPLASVRGCLGQCTHSDWAAQAAQARARIKSIPADPSQARTQDTHRPGPGPGCCLSLDTPDMHYRAVVLSTPSLGSSLSIVIRLSS